MSSNYIHYQIKLADFGFARHFKDEGNKTIDMTSLAGTPVFMVSMTPDFVNLISFYIWQAPEALSCVFHPGEVSTVLSNKSYVIAPHTHAQQGV